ncbi:Signal transduction histidine kinase [Arboricoccus pini]|uniref:histidine kinase n=1 Tax=Arboricoccus pini TaxID=1963835 RepID=A0A212RMW6_9PROT|nr:HAMP domain-containing sensor histidine kinase [Arboricoccus pini]SNB73904.1 Signal transduction histidine kinase [Arboricoccus pini]
MPVTAYVPPFSFIRSATFRIVLIGVALFLCALTLVFSATYIFTARELLRMLDDDIISEMSELDTQAAASGLPAIRAAVELRMNDPAGSTGYYTLIDASDHLLLSNLPLAQPRDGWFDLLLPHERGAPETIRVEGKRLAGNLFLAIGRSRADIDTIRAIFVRNFLICVAATILLTLAASSLFVSRILRRVEGINHAVDEIMGGDLSRRVPTGRRTDEFDELALRLNAMLDRITALMSQVRQVSDDIAHDLRTPLARLRQELYLVRRRAGTMADYEGAVDAAIEEADAIIATFASLLRIAQVEAGARRAGFRRVDLSELAEAMVESYTPVAEDRQQILEAEVRPGLEVVGDRELLGQMLANLIENALNHGPKGARLDLRLRQINGTPELCMIDDGPGIPTEMRGEVFKRFVRLDKSRGKGGTGLGLSLVRAIADLHGLEVRLEDAWPGRLPPGLCVRVRFGEARPPSPGADDPRQSPVPGKSSMVRGLTPNGSQRIIS